MTIINLPLVYCDAGIRSPDCEGSPEEPMQGDRNTTGSAMVRRAGWRTRPGGRHICPPCAALKFPTSGEKG